MAKKISEELYQSYLRWAEIENRSTDLHFAMSVLIEKHLGPDHDRIDNGRLIVDLARMEIARGDGVSPSGQASVSEADNDGSNPSTPKVVPPKPVLPQNQLIAESDEKHGRSRTVVISPDGKVAVGEEKKHFLTVEGAKEVSKALGFNTQEEETDGETKKDKGKRKRVAVARKKKPPRKVAAKRIQPGN